MNKNIENINIADLASMGRVQLTELTGSAYYIPQGIMGTTPDTSKVLDAVDALVLGSASGASEDRIRALAATLIGFVPDKAQVKALVADFKRWRQESIEKIEAQVKAQAEAAAEAEAKSRAEAEAKADAEAFDFSSPDGSLPAAEGAVPSKDAHWVATAQFRSVCSYIKKCSTPEPIFLGGPQGTGKTATAKQVAALMGREFALVNCQAWTSPDSVMGNWTLAKGETVFKRSLLAEAIGRPGVVLLDELNRSDRKALNVLLSLLDGFGVECPGTGERIRKHDQCVVFATSNFGREFVGTERLDAAIMDRFGLVLEVEFLPEAQEANLIAQKTGLESTAAKRVAKFVNSCRKLQESGAISETIGTRAALSLAKAMAAGLSPESAAELVIFNKIRHDVAAGENSPRNIVRQAYQAFMAEASK